jgi:deoxyribodipyrimidine photo-lyase
MHNKQEFPPDRAAALQRLQDFVARAGRDYAEERNYDRGPAKRGNVSGLSPYIRHRLLTETEVLMPVLAQHGVEQAERFVQEVFWRGYWRGWLEGRPAVWQRYRQRLDQQLQALDRGGVGTAYRQAIESKTGIDCFDAWSKELLETGYLHNHARMWFASIWIFSLRLPWELGADLFMRHLLDGDPASNTLSWRWVAGLHTKGKHYLAQRENIHRYTEGRFFPRGLVKSAAPLEEVVADSQRPIAPASPMPDGDFALLLTDDDLGIESMDLPWERVRAIGLLDTSAGRSPSPLGDVPKNFIAGALDDTEQRAKARHAGLPVLQLSATGSDAHEALLRLASAGGVKQVVTYWPAAGPLSQWLAPAASEALTAGVTASFLRRSFDTRLWPHAQRGFFQLKEKMQELLVAEGLLAAVSVRSAPKKPVIRFR